MLARQPVSAIPQQVFGHAPAVLGDALLENVNLSVWQRQLPPHIAGFAQTLMALGEPLAESLTIEPDANGGSRRLL